MLESKQVKGIRVHQIKPNQRIFIDTYVLTGNMTKSAAAAKVPKGTAYDWKNTPTIAKEIETLRAALREKTGYTMEVAMSECEEAVEFARGTKNANAYVKALELKAKLNGLLIEKHDHRMVANFAINVEGVRGSALPAPNAQLEGGTGPVPFNGEPFKQLVAQTVKSKTNDDDDGADELGL